MEADARISLNLELKVQTDKTEHISERLRTTEDTPLVSSPDLQPEEANALRRTIANHCIRELYC